MANFYNNYIYLEGDVDQLTQIEEYITDNHDHGDCMVEDILKTLGVDTSEMKLYGAKITFLSFRDGILCIEGPSRNAPPADAFDWLISRFPDIKVWYDCVDHLTGGFTNDHDFRFHKGDYGLLFSSEDEMKWFKTLEDAAAYVSVYLGKTIPADWDIILDAVGIDGAGVLVYCFRYRN